MAHVGRKYEVVSSTMHTLQDSFNYLLDSQYVAEGNCVLLFLQVLQIAEPADTAVKGVLRLFCIGNYITLTIRTYSFFVMFSCK